MDFLIRAGETPESLAILPGSFHPVTRAHMALVQAGLERTGEVLLVMPRVLPHREYEHVAMDRRLEIVRAAIGRLSRVSLAVSEGGLFRQIARECRPPYGEACALWFLCGRDAAERILTWDYPDVPVARQLDEFGLLVANRDGEFKVPPGLPGRIRTLDLDPAPEGISASEVRRRIRAGESWEDLVPESAAALIRRYYAG